jgi:putative methionine-R-sulfoxide reductase with GAF domain
VLANLEEPAALVDRSSLLNALDAVRREVQSMSADPDAALRLVADRALAFTGAAGSAIAVQEDEKMVCRASSGKDAPPLGASFQTGSGFSGECVRRRTMLRCDDAEIDPRVDQESCRELGIRSMLAVPLLSGDSVVGLLEIFSPAPAAFHERDEEIMARMAEFAVAVLGEKNAAPSTASSFPFSDTLSQDTHGIPLQRLHVILLIAAAALIALSLGYLLAPWLQQMFSPTPKLAPSVSREQPQLQPVASKSAPRSPVSQATTMDQMRQLAENGDAAAQFSMGTHYAIGDGVKLDNVEAARWLIKAAEQGHVIAQDTMGAYYQVGRGVPKDLRKAYFWSLLGRAGNNQTSKYRIMTLNAVLSREEIEAARQEAEQWIHQHAAAGKPSSPNP